MVDLVEDWEILERYAKDKQGYYQILGDDEVLEIRVTVGRLGFKKEFENNEDRLLHHILAFCKFRSFIKVSENVRDEFFFK